MTLFSTEGDFDEKWLLALLCYLAPMRPLRLQAIQVSYPSLFQAFDDNFSAFNSTNNPWVVKVRSVNWAEEYNALQQNCKRFSIELLTVWDENFPKQFAQLSDQPLVLYFQGNLEALNSTNEMVTVVGSRNFSRYSQLVMNHVLQPACSRGLGVVSGLALGIDGLSHQIALQSKALTIAVIGSGLDDNSFYPSQHQGLKKQILDSNGLIITEYAPGVSATKFTFPKRNRLLAALTPLTWVVQAGHKSGTLITASCAQDLGKIVAATPSSILEESMEGSIQLLKDGAQIITCADDIFGLLNLRSYAQIQPQKIVEFSSTAEKNVYEFLSLTPKLADEIAAALSMEIFELSTHLTMLEIQGMAVNVGQNLWVKGA